MFAEPKNLSATFPKIILIDLVILGLALAIPALSHVLPVPLYYLDPMRIFVLSGYFFSRSNLNGYFLAIVIPLFSMWVTGHPVFIKSILIVLELSVNIYIFNYLSGKIKEKLFFNVWFSILISKVIYYILKSIFIHFAFLEGKLISTPVFEQVINITFISILFAVMTKIKGITGDK